MQRHQQEFQVTCMCRVLQVSRSGFYGWCQRKPSARTQANQALTEQIRVLHRQTREAYGTRKMWQLLHQHGLPCGRHRVARLRREAGLVTLRRRRHTRVVAEDMKMFRASAPPGWRVHLLSGDRKGTWSISTSGNWRITFEEEDGYVDVLDLEDYH